VHTFVCVWECSRYVYMCVCVCVCIWVLGVCVHGCVGAFAYFWMGARVCLWGVWVSRRAGVFVYECMRVGVLCVCMYVCMRVCMFVDMHTPMSVHKHTHLHVCVCVHGYVRCHVCGCDSGHS